MAVDEVVLFREVVVFKQYIPKKHKCFVIQLYLSVPNGYTYDMKVYLGWTNSALHNTR
jgi:hypothetical protein